MPQCCLKRPHVSVRDQNSHNTMRHHPAKPSRASHKVGYINQYTGTGRVGVGVGGGIEEMATVCVSLSLSPPLSLYIYISRHLSLYLSVSLSLLPLSTFLPAALLPFFLSLAAFSRSSLSHGAYRPPPFPPHGVHAPTLINFL